MAFEFFSETVHFTSSQMLALPAPPGNQTYVQQGRIRVVRGGTAEGGPLRHGDPHADSLALTGDGVRAHADRPRRVALAEVSEELVAHYTKRVHQKLDEKYGFYEAMTFGYKAILSSPLFRCYSNPDVVGVELGGALRNVIAIAVGCADGMGLGLNTRAALIARGLAEMRRLGERLGAHPVTFQGLSGVGDLILTCTGDLSRNRRVGLEIGKGRSVPRILAGLREVAEGVITARSAYESAQKYGVDMPITEETYRVLHEGKDPKLAIRDLMTRQLRSELE